MAVSYLTAKSATDLQKTCEEQLRLSMFLFFQIYPHIRFTFSIATDKPLAGLGGARDTPRAKSSLLPPAYVVRREGTVFTGVCRKGGGCSTSSQLGGGHPIQLTGGGGYPGQVSGQCGVPPPAGQDGEHPPSPWETKQQSEYLRYGGRYASCVYAGLSCYYAVFRKNYSNSTSMLVPLLPKGLAPPPPEILEPPLTI